MKPAQKKQLERLSNKAQFIPIKSEHYKLLPPATHIGYIYRDFSGNIVPIVSAFIKEHYTDSAGIDGMLIKCGTSSYVNPYQTLIKVYIYAKDRQKVENAIKQKLSQAPAVEPDIEQRLKKLETNIGNIVSCITRSVSSTQLKQEEPKPVVVKKSRSLTHDEKKPKLKPKSKSKRKIAF